MMRWRPVTFYSPPGLCSKSHRDGVDQGARASWVCIKDPVMNPPLFVSSLPERKLKHGQEQKWERERGQREGGRLWIDRVSGMHGQPLCLSKTLQQLPARDKSNHSQPTPPFPPPPTHQHTPVHSFSLPPSLFHIHKFLCASASFAGSDTDAVISSRLRSKWEVFPWNNFSAVL